MFVRRPSLLPWLLALALTSCSSSHHLKVGILGPAGVVAGGSAHLTAWIAGGHRDLKCIWTGGSGQVGSDCTGVDVSPKAATTYTLKVTNRSGAKASASIALHIYDALSISVPNEVDIVRGESATITATQSGGVPDVTCTWLANGAQVSSECSGIQVQPTGDTVYGLVVVDGDGDIQLGSTLVRVFDPLAAALTPPGPQQALSGDTVVLSPTLAGGIPPRSCIWKQDGTQISTDCAPYSYTAASTSTFTLSVTDANGHTAQASTEVRVLKAVPIAPQTVISNDTLSLDGAATGLIGAAQCLWVNALGAQLNSGTDCHLELTLTADAQLTLTLTDAATGRSVSTEVPVSVLDPTCSDGVQNGVETDVDCGGHIRVEWLNEFLAISIPGTGSLLGAEVVAKPTLNPATLTPALYELNSDHSAYVPLAAQPLAGQPGQAGCVTQQASGGVQTIACAISATAPNMAFTVARADGSLIDFVILTGTAQVPASGGPADGRTPRPLGVTMTVATLNPTTGKLPTTDTCLQGTGDRAADFTWHTDCAITIQGPTGATGGLNPNQTVTGFPSDCSRCAQGQKCAVNADCASSLTCDATSMTCTP